MPSASPIPPFLYRMMAYIIDTPRCLHPQILMSNMLQVATCSWCPLQ